MEGIKMGYFLAGFTVAILVTVAISEVQFA